MFRFRILLSVALAVIAAGCGGRMESESPVVDARPVRFVVMGDSQPPRPGDLGLPEVFTQIVREVNQWQPALVVNCGDHISGYTDDVALINRMWDEYFEMDSTYTAPSHHAPGNHDAWDDRSEAVYLERVGKKYYSFDHENCHFIILDSENRQHPDQIAAEQLAWLTRDLEANREAEHIFVFLHKPLWLSWDWKTYRKNAWDRDVHPLLKRHRVSAVFSGHYHMYGKAERDGVRYIITGGAGGMMGDQPDAEQGHFFHYCQVTVQGPDVSIAVIKPNNGGVLSENAILYDELQSSKRSAELWNARARAWRLRREGEYQEAAQAWEQTLKYSGPLFGNRAKTVFEDIEQDLRSAGRLDDYVAFLGEQSATYPDGGYDVWRDLTLAAIHLERGQDDRARALQNQLLAQHAQDEAVVSRIYHDIAVHSRKAGLVKIEGEDFTAEGGGRVRIREKARASQKAFTGWDNAGHWLQWRLNIPRQGRYYLIFRFAHGYQDKVGTHKVITIDGTEIDKSFFWFSGGWASRSDDWAFKMLTNADKTPLALDFTKGEHTLRMEAPPGKPRGLILDYILLAPAFDISRP